MNSINLFKIFFKKKVDKLKKNDILVIVTIIVIKKWGKHD